MRRACTTTDERRETAAALTPDLARRAIVADVLGHDEIGTDKVGPGKGLSIAQLA